MSDKKQRKQYPSTLVATVRINCRTLKNMRPGSVYPFVFQSKDRLTTLAEGIGMKGGWKAIAECLDLSSEEGRARQAEIAKAGSSSENYPTRRQSKTDSAAPPGGGRRRRKAGG